MVFGAAQAVVDQIVAAVAGGVVGSGITALVSLSRLARIETDLEWIKEKLKGISNDAQH